MVDMNIDKESLSVKLFADGADLNDMVEMAARPYISGLTTNPTLMKKAGISNYVNFAKDVLREIPNKPVSFEVFADDLSEMQIQAEKIASWGENVFVKIPITNTKGNSTSSVIENLTNKEIKVNVTALMTSAQVKNLSNVLNPGVKSFVSVFAGRIADTGRNPVPIIEESLLVLEDNKLAELIWASPRELYNVIQANETGCHIITATKDILGKLDLIGYDLELFSLDTVKMFYEDGVKSQLSI
jgi:transaldolase